MALTHIPLLCLLLVGCSTQTIAQLYPAGTKLHVVHLGSYYETNHQTYLHVAMHNQTLENKQEYTHISYPDWRTSIHNLRIDSNKLYDASGPEKLMLFDFTAHEGDSLSIFQHVFNSGKPVFDPQIRVGPARIRVDSIRYQYYYTESNQRDSLKQFFYSGTVMIVPALMAPPVPYTFRTSIIEKIITIYTTGSMRGYLAINVGPRTLSDDHERLRCVEFPNGTLMTMAWWYDMVQHTIPCDYRYNVGTPERSAGMLPEAYPNPSGNQFYLRNYEGAIRLFDQLGRVVYTGTVESGMPIDTRGLPAGLYSVSTASGHCFPLSIIH